MSYYEPPLFQGMSSVSPVFYTEATVTVPQHKQQPNKLFTLVFESSRGGLVRIFVALIQVERVVRTVDRIPAWDVT